MEINGLPLHPLIVHAAVVFTPLAALVALAYVLVPRWRDRLRWPMIVLAVVAGLSIGAAYLSGDSFLESRPELEQSPLVEKHEERAQKLLWVAIAFSLVALAAGWLHARTGAVRIVTSIALAVLAVGVLVLVVLTGDAGARAVWER